VLFDDETIRDGQNVWQSIGGQEVGSVFGHGAYVAPDWTADWLHRESVFTLDSWARAEGAQDYASLDVERQASLRARLEREMRTNTYDPATGRLTISPTRAEAIEKLTAYYADVFAAGRNEYAIPAGSLSDAEKARQMGAFFFWTSWVASTNRPGDRVSYTQNWPHEPLVSNVVTGDSVVWSVISFVLLLAGIGGMVWYFASQEKEAAHGEVPANDPLLGVNITPSQRATFKYFFVAVAFWNFVGAGLFGFLINPPVALYYMQGLNTTPLHGHTALFGVYGMLGIGLTLFCLRALRGGRAWKEWPLRWSFWLINGGLALMVLLSLLPIGLMPTWASVEYGTWYARSAEFLQTGLMNDLRWMRAVGDTTFALGALILGYFILGLITGHSYTKGEPAEVKEPELALPRGAAHATAAD
jgi:nitric oxide reductase large subunit